MRALAAALMLVGCTTSHAPPDAAPTDRECLEWRYDPSAPEDVWCVRWAAPDDGEP